MKFHELPVEGAYGVEVERVPDDRGWFGRLFSADAYAQLGLDTRVEQCSFSFNRQKATLRGMHFQRPPFEEAKLVLCTGGAVFDVIIDLRPGSKTFRAWASLELTAAHPLALYVPAGVAHGFLTLVDDSTVYYQISAPYSADHAAGVRWDDPAFDVRWPERPQVISPRDLNFENFSA